MEKKAFRKHKFDGIPWYKHEKSSLEQQIKECFLDEVGPKNLPNKVIKSHRNIIGIVSPHAGFSCSGPHAAHGFLELSKMDNIDTYILLGTNHTGFGPEISIFPKGKWETPLGQLDVDEELHDALINELKTIKDEFNYGIDVEAHKTEHSIDNQIPFIQFISPKPVKILPICVGNHSLSVCEKFGEVLQKVLDSTEKNVVIISSSDFTHYLSPGEAKKRDRPVIESLLSGEIKQASENQRNLRASICGFGPILILFSLAKKLQPNISKELIYGHSGETCGGSLEVVAYSSILIEK